MTALLPPGHRAARCPRCGGPFACGADADRATPCACVRHPLGTPRLAELRARWPDCLCGACLAALAADPELAA